jgi:DNA-binding response OmpR family regulator
MASLPRIITVDPTGIIPQQIRAAFELMDYLVVQIDVPGPTEALEELERGGIDAVISAWSLGNGVQGWALAAELKKVQEDISIIVLGEKADTELDEETLSQSPFVYLKRPFDIPQLIRVLKAAVKNGGDIFAAIEAPKSSSSAVAVMLDMGPIPMVDETRAGEVMQGLLTDLNPIAAMLATRTGEIVVGRTTMGDIDYDYMAGLFSTMTNVTVEMRDITGGNTQVFQFYDGDTYDVFVLSVGLHHFLVIVFDGADGGRQLGAVSRFGRRHAEDLVAVMGPAAFFIQPAIPQEEPEVRRKSEQARKVATQEMAIPELARAQLGSDDAIDEEDDDEPTEMESSIPQLEAIADDAFDADALFGDDFDEAAADDMFSLDVLEEIAADEGKKGTLDWDHAKELGILDD